MLKSIFNCCPYILYKWPKITFCLLPNPSKKVEICKGTFFYHQDDILKFWRWLFFLNQMRERIVLARSMHLTVINDCIIMTS